MSYILKRDSNSISIASFYENLIKYNFSPSYQRESVWSEEKQSFLIDSIMRNFPVPPIFLRQKIDDESGKTSYDVIDGKQRLTSIIRFIKDEIPISTEEEPDDKEYEKIAGLFFSQLDSSEEGKNAKKHFWRYYLPVEYIDSESDELIKHIFDRLNRNGEPLTGQELRNARYNEKYFHKKIGDIAKEEVWKELLSKVDAVRMENSEFISELLFEVGENKPLHATQDVIDDFYDVYSKKEDSQIDGIVERFRTITSYIIELGAKEYCMNGVSHFYGIWCFADHCVRNGVEINLIKEKFDNFFSLYEKRNYSDPEILEYKKSMSSNTKSSSSRLKRRNALIKYCITDKLVSTALF